VVPVTVLGAGLITADIISGTDSHWHLQPGEPTYIAGGTVCNILSYLSAWGWNTAVFGGVGDDELGLVVRDDLAARGIDARGLIIRSSAKTRRIAHLVAMRGSRRGTHRFATNCPGCGAHFPSFVTPGVGQVASHLPESTQETILVVDRANELTLALAERVAKAGGIVVFEPGHLPDSPVVEDLLQYVSFLKFSRELTWGGRPFLSRVPKDLPSLDLIIETRGEDGVHVLDGSFELRLTKIASIDSVDTAGAGDGFMAGLMIGLGPARLGHLDSLAESELEGAVRRGQALGALACLHVGGKGILYRHTPEEIDAAIDQTIADRAPPSDFGSREFPPSAALPWSAAAGTCALCRLPSPRGGRS
jgi:sugar/nucleoside kinase (ribokinase family)